MVEMSPALTSVRLYDFNATRANSCMKVVLGIKMGPLLSAYF